MKKLLLFCVLALCVCSCNVIKHNPSIMKQIDFVLKGQRMTKKMELTYHYSKNNPFIFDDNAIFIPCKIDDTTHLVFYDNRSNGIGTTRGFLTEKIPGNIELPKCNKTIKLRKERKTKNSSNHRIIIKSGLKYYDVESDFFHFKNLVGVVTSLSNDTTTLNCTPEKNSRRFVINDILLDWKNAMLLSFSDTIITLFDSISMYDTTDFTLVKSLFTCKGIEIYLTINSIEHAFLFSTASKDFLTLSQYSEHRSESDAIDTLIIPRTNTIIMGNMVFIEENIYYTKEIHHSVMGVAFISHFDWIIDKYRQKIYVKKIRI